MHLFEVVWLAEMAFGGIDLTHAGEVLGTNIQLGFFWHQYKPNELLTKFARVWKSAET